MNNSLLSTYCNAVDKYNSSKEPLDKKVDGVVKNLEEIMTYKKCDNYLPYALLFLCYLQKKMYIQACYVIAKYNIPCDFEPIFFDVPEGIKTSFDGNPKTYEDILIKALLANDDIYKQAIGIVDDKSYELGKILICVSRYKNNKGDISRLSYCINNLQNMDAEECIRRKWILNGLWFDLDIHIQRDKYYFERMSLFFAADKLNDLLIVNDDEKIIKDQINAAYKLYTCKKSIIDKQAYGEMDYFWTAIISGLIHLKQYTLAVNIYKEQSHKVSDAAFFLNAAKALIEIGNASDGIAACRISCSLFQNSENLLLLAKCLFHSNQYEEAKKVYMDACNLLKEKKEITVFYRGSLKYNKHKFLVDYEGEEIQNIKKQAYNSLLYCYIRLNEFVSAEQLIQKAEKEIIDVTLVDQMKSLMEMSTLATGEIEKLQADKIDIEAAFEAERIKNNKYKTVVSQVENMLNQIRRNDSVEIDDSMWNECFSSKMNEIVASIRNQIGSNKENAYNCIYKDIKKKYPKMKENTIRTLASAKQLYNVFSNNVYFDEAPIIIEYSRAVEMLLWDYVEGSKIYLKEIEEACSHRNQGKTFGAVNYVINCQHCPLRRVYNELNALRKTRNNSAHVTDKDKDVYMSAKKVHDFIWNPNGLLDIINSLWT